MMPNCSPIRNVQLTASACSSRRPAWLDDDPSSA
jgi:hypothetical protein